jgi:hypothetical protein
VPADIFVIAQYILGEQSLFFAVCLLCLAVAIMLHCFYIYHLWLIHQGTTTNEFSKRGGLKRFLKGNIKFL